MNLPDRFAVCLPRILRHEGGYVNNPHDRGGPTNLGVTIPTLSAFEHHAVTVDEIKTLTPATVASLYRALYWNAAHCDALPKGVDYIVFDAGVLSGVGRAVRVLQALVGAEPDGAIGPRTLAAVATMPPTEIVRAFCSHREAYYRGLADFVHFGRGWLSRLAETQAQALADAS
jgi:lysozyme family protein